MRRRLHLIFAAATVLLLVAWPLSGRWYAGASVGLGSRAFAGAFRGRIFVGFLKETPPSRRRLVEGYFKDMGAPGYPLELLPAWEWRRQSTLAMPARTWRRTALEIPLWMPASLTGVATAPLWWRHRRRLRRERAGKCFFCGYDLAGVQISDAGKLRCPECGKRLRVKGWSAGYSPILSQ